MVKIADPFLTYNKGPNQLEQESNFDILATSTYGWNKEPTNSIVWFHLGTTPWTNAQ